jgi:Ser/Thr protein kinase RdoA (MazF antagonist)
MKTKGTLHKRDIEAILNNYAIGEYLSHKKMWWSLTNALYHVKTTDKEIILKVFGEGNVQKKKAIVTIMEEVRKQGVPIPKIFADKNNAFLHDYKNWDLTIQEFVKGDARPQMSPAYTRELARVLGVISISLLKIKNQTIKSNFDYQFNKTSYRSDDIIFGFDYKSAEENVLLELNKNVNKKKYNSFRFYFE